MSKKWAYKPEHAFRVVLSNLMVHKFIPSLRTQNLFLLERDLPAEKKESDKYNLCTTEKHMELKE